MTEREKRPKRAVQTHSIHTKRQTKTNATCKHTVPGKIQGDGRKILDRLKSYFGSQISSWSLNEIHIYRLQPKSAMFKRWVLLLLFFLIYFCLWLSVRVGACCPLTFVLVSHLQRERFLRADFGKTIVLTTQRSQTAICSYIFRDFNCCSLFNEGAYLAALRRLRSPFCNPWRQLETIEDKNIYLWKKITFCCGFRL